MTRRDETATRTFTAAPLDRPTRVVTFAVIVLFIVVLPIVALTGNRTGAASGAVLGTTAGLLLLGAWGFSPEAYELDGATLRIRRRLFGSRAFTLRKPPKRAPATLGLGVRFGLSGGVFGWAGTFWQAGVGRYHAYFTDRSRLVACETDHGLVVVSPADPKAFLRSAKRTMQ